MAIKFSCYIVIVCVLIVGLISRFNTPLSIIEYGLSLLNMDFPYIIYLNDTDLKEEKITDILRKLKELENGKVDLEMMLKQSEADREYLLTYLDKYQKQDYSKSLIAFVVTMTIGAMVYHWVLGSDSNALTSLIMKTVCDSSVICNDHTSIAVKEVISNTTKQILELTTHIKHLKMNMQDMDEKLIVLMETLDTLTRGKK